MWYSDLFFFGVGKEEQETAFWMDFVSLETAMSLKSGHFRGIFRDRDTSNFS